MFVKIIKESIVRIAPSTATKISKLLSFA